MAIDLAMNKVGTSFGASRDARETVPTDIAGSSGEHEMNNN
jgi:hypothetical protein